MILLELALQSASADACWTLAQQLGCEGRIGMQVRVLCMRIRLKHNLADFLSELLSQYV